MKKTITLLLFAVICIVGTSNAQRAQSTPIDELLNRLEQIGNSHGSISDYFTQEEQIQLRAHLSRKGVSTTQTVGTRSIDPNSSFVSASISGANVYNGPAGTATREAKGDQDQTRMPVVITHSNTQTIEAGAEIACANATRFTDNWMHRAFDLANDFGIAGDFDVTDAEIAIGVGVITPAGFPMTVNIYSSDSQDVDTATLTLLGTGVGTIVAGDSETIVSIPVAATVPAGEIMVLEVVIIDDLTDSNYMRFGCNNDGETGPSWIMAPECGAAVPTRFSDLGLTQGLVMNVVGDEATSGGGSAWCAMNATNEFGTFDPADGSVVTAIGPGVTSGAFENAGSIDPTDANTAYVLDNAGDAYSVDVTTGVYTSLGNIAGGWIAGEFDHNSGVFYALADDTNLYTIDFGALTATSVGSTGLGLGIGLAIDGAGNAYTYDLADDNLYAIDLGTGAATLVGPIGFDANFGQGMFWDAASDTVLMTAFNAVVFDSELRSVDTATGATTLINQMDIAALTQYAWSSAPAVVVPPFVCTGSNVQYDATGLPFDIDGADDTTADCVAAPNLVPVTVTAANGGTIGVDAAIDNVTVDITHTWSADLELSLVSPAGTELVLADNVGGNDDDAYNNTIFMDGGADITAATPPYNAEPFAPMGGTFAAAFDGETLAGDWQLKLCDTAGGDTGQVIAFSITMCEPDPAGPPNDECVDAAAVACGDVVVGETITATDSGQNAAPDLWYSFTGTGTEEDVTLSFCDGGTDYDSLVRVFDACGGTEIAVNDDSCGLQSEVTFTSDGTSTYYIMVEGFGSNSGNFSMEVSCVTVIGTDENAIAGFNYYPNPATNAINLSAQSNIEAVAIYNVLGQKVVDQNVEAISTSLDISNLSVGTYIMKVSVDGQVGTYKLIKK